MEQNRMTLEQIAAKINISRTTIYKVLNNKGTVSEATRQAVLAALGEYNYIPNESARNLARNREYSICYVGFRTSSAAYFSNLILQGIAQAQDQYRDSGLRVTVREYTIHSAQQPLDILQQLYRQGERNFIVSAWDIQLMGTQLAQMVAQGCLVLLLSRDIPHLDCAGYVGVDYRQSGLLGAELMAKMLPDGAKLQLLVTDELAQNSDIQSRHDSFLQGISQYPHIQLLPVRYGLTSQQVYPQTLALLEHGDRRPDGIFDLTYCLDQVAEAVEHCGLQHRIKLAGFDLFEQIRPMIVRQTIDAVIFQDLSAQARLAVELLFEKISRQQPISQKKYYSRLDIVLCHNIQYF